MTTEQLLIPRYKVIGLYPNSPFSLYDIIELDRKEGGKYFKAYPPMHCEEEILDKYPNIFDKMFWYQNRCLSDLPEYIKMNDIVYKLHGWKGSITGYTPTLLSGSDLDNYIAVTWHFDKKISLPSTEEEYNEYIAKKNK